MNDIFGFVRSVGNIIFSAGGCNGEEQETKSPSQQPPSEDKTNPVVKSEEDTDGSSPMRGPDPVPGTVTATATTTATATGMALSSQQLLNTNNNNSPVIDLLSTDDEVVGGDDGYEGSSKAIETALTTNKLSLDADLKAMRNSSAEVSGEIANANGTALKPTASPSTKSPSLATSDTSNVYDDEEEGGDEGKENATRIPTVNTASVTTISKLLQDPIEASGANFGTTIAGTKPPPATTTMSEASNVFAETNRCRRSSNNSTSSTAKVSSTSSDSKWGENRPQKKRKINSNINNNTSLQPSEPQSSGTGVSRPLLSSPLKETNIENPSETDNRGTQQDQEHALTASLEEKSSDTLPNNNNSIATRDSKGPPGVDFKEIMIESNKSEEKQEGCLSGNDNEKTSTACAESNSIQSEKVLQPVETNEAKCASPDRVVPQFRLPPELVPYNKPGVCDYGVIRTSRLRNRAKKSDTQEDVLYQNIQGQRRCKATKDGRIMNSASETNRCLNCAEGVFKFCHTHRELDFDQRMYWEKRRGQLGSAGRSSSTIKSNLTPKLGTTNVRKTARTKLNQKAGSGSKPKGPQANGSYSINDVKQCVFLMTLKDGQRKRCSRHGLTTKSGYCVSHVRFAPPVKKDEFFRGHPGSMRCTAVSKAGTMCRYKAMYQCVFCCKHTNVPTEKISPIEIVDKKNMKAEDTIGICPTDGPTDNYALTEHSTQRPRGKKVKTKHVVADARHSVDDSTMNMYSSEELECTKKRSKPSKYESASRSSFAGSNQVPKNIEFRRQIEIPKRTLQLACSSEDRCHFIQKFNRCTYKCVEGDILCFKCRLCVEEGGPFDRIILDNSAQPNESMLSSNKCVNVLRGIQCEEMASGGEILCKDCLRSFGGKKKSMFELPNDSEDSESEEISNTMGTSSSPDDTDTMFSDSDDSEDSHGSDGTDYDAYCNAYTHREFFNMWKNFERKTEKMDEVEDSKLIKRANNMMDPTDTDGQVKAQYGRVLPHAMKKMIKILELGRDDIFLDIGHGVGNTCLHASFCIGCDSRGIEVVSDRHEIAEKFRGGMYAEHNGRLEARQNIGNVDLRLGRLEDPDQKDFLTNGVTRTYVNNFNGVFAERSSKNNDKWFLDDYISGIFASMAPGAIMVTFHPLNLGLDRDSANELRNRHDLEESEYASYYHSEKILLGKAWNSVKWNKRSGNTNEIYVYKYRRLHQPNHYDAVFLCSNPTCKLAIDMIPIPATTLNEDGRCVINHCKCKYSPKNLRKRNSK